MLHLLHRFVARRAVRTMMSLLAASLAGLSVPGYAAPAEGTADQRVTGRSFQQHHEAVRGATTVAAAAPGDASRAWKGLTPAQRHALQPLAPHWDRLSEERKLKWLVISKNFAKLPPEEQARVHRRMSRWATLSQKERDRARQNYTEIKGLTPGQKAAEWEAYKALSAEEKRKLAAQAPRKPAGAAKAVSVKKAARRFVLPASRMAESRPPIQQHTLLPLPQPVRTEIERSPYDDEPADDE
jgi:hypothetical protein